MGYNIRMDDSSKEKTQRPTEGKVGPLSATIIIVLILLIAGVYFLVQEERQHRELKQKEQQMQLPNNS